MKAVRYTLVIIELAMLIAFMKPFFLSITNAGNLLGALVSAFFLCITVWWEKFSGFIGNAWSHIPGKILLSIAGIIIAAGIFFGGFLTVNMIRAMNNTPDKPCTVVVLGCHVKGTKPSLMLTRRLNAAYDYMTENPDAVCVVTGGQGVGEDISEGQAMKTYLVEKGIDSGRIYAEEKSVNTHENIAFAKEIIEEEELIGDIVIITDGFHQYRASIIAEKLGIESYSVSCETRKDLVLTYWVRELLALAKEIFLN